MTINTYSSFKYSQGKYGASTTEDRLLWGIQADWNGDNFNSAGNMAENVIDLNIRRGRDYFIRLDIDNNANGFLPVRPGRMTITLDDPDEIYDPNNTDSPLYPSIEPGVTIRAFVRPLPDADIKNLFYGEITDIQSFYVGNTHRVTISAVDGLQKFSDLDVRTTIVEDRTTTQNVVTILNQIEWPINKRNIIDSDYLIPYWWEDRRAFSALNDLAETEGGYFFVDAAGNAAYYSQFYEPPIVATFDQSEVLKNISTLRPWESVRNRIRANANPVRLGSSQEIWRLLETPVLAVGESRIIWASYNVDNQNVAGVDVITPAATTDYLANSKADGTGTNLTSSITLTFAAFGEAARIRLFNNSSTPAFITLLKIRGKPLTQSAPLFSEVIIPPATRLFTSDTPWRQTSAQASDFASWLSFFIASSKTYPTIKIESRPDKQFEMDLFDRVSIDLQKNQIVGNLTVGMIEHRWLKANGQAVETTLRFEPSRVLSDTLVPVTAEQSVVGADEHIEFGNIPAISNLTVRTITGWLYPLDTAQPGGNYGLYFLGWNDIYLLGWSPSLKRLVLFARYDEAFIGVWATPDDSAPTNAWQHVTFVHDRSSNIYNPPVIYIDGVSQVITEVVDPSTTSPAIRSETNTLFSLGNYYQSTVPYTLQFTGLYRDMRVYNRALTAQEAADLYNDVAVDDTGLLFNAPYIPVGQKPQYIDKALNTKPVYDVIAGRTGTTSKQYYPIIREFDYDPST